MLKFIQSTRQNINLVLAFSVPGPFKGFTDKVQEFFPLVKENSEYKLKKARKRTFHTTKVVPGCEWRS